jgi:hypothetical protein
MGQTYAGSVASAFAADRLLPEWALAGSGDAEDFAGAGVPSMTRFDDNGTSRFKYVWGWPLNFSTHEAQQK